MLTIVPRRKILLVDDNADASQLLAELLAMTGHDIRIAADGPAAIATALEFDPDIVLCDIGLPGMDGYEVARELRRLPRGESMTLAALTGYGEESARAEAARAGFDEHLMKPVDPTYLESFITALASKARQP
ncbi:MAG TPA: response regulator [Burkholderiaceae bacterium]|nr:response regulator [Burkholderiaceae bacterium]